jgi:hypothetical protein
MFRMARTRGRRIIMSIKKNLMVPALCVMVLAFCTFAWAGGTNLTLMADKSHSGATGTAYLDENSIKIEAKGLKANGVYTAWFVNMKPKKQETGAGAIHVQYGFQGKRHIRIQPFRVSIREMVNAHDCPSPYR